MKFNVDRVARDKPRLAGIELFSEMVKGKCFFMFSKHVGIKRFNEVEVPAILEAFRIFTSSFVGILIVESDSSNAIT